jgi:hypothetical protein
METTIRRYKLLNAAALLFVLPTVYFISISILKFELGIAGPYNTSEPLLEQLGISEPLGWNINLLILPGPVVALCIALFQVLHIDWQFTKEKIQFQFAIQKKWFPIVIILISGLVLASLFSYLILENYNHYE